MKRLGAGVVGVTSVLVACATTSGDARAAGFASARFGGEQGNPVSTNPTSLYFNPGAMGFSEGIHLFVDGEIALRHATWDHPAPAGQMLQPQDAGNYGTAHLMNVFAGPALAATGKFGNFAVGAGLFVPFGGRVHWGASDQTDLSLPLTADGVQRWHLTDAALTFIQVTAGAAYKLGPISIGATGSFINSQVSESESHTIAGYIDSTNEKTADLNVSGNNGSFAVGMMAEVVPEHLWLGASYQSQPGLGPQTLKGTLTYNNGPAPYYAQTGQTQYNVDFHQSLPDIIRGGIRVRPTDDIELRLFGDFTRWSVMTDQCVNDAAGGPSCLVHADGSDATPKGSVLANIPRDWKNTYGVRLGGSYFVNPAVELFAGAGYETGAAPDATMEPGAMDGNNVAGAIGGRFLIANYVYFAASYTQIYFFTRDVTTSELATNNGNLVQVPTQQQDGNGIYTQWIGIFDLNLEKQF